MVPSTVKLTGRRPICLNTNTYRIIYGYMIWRSIQCSMGTLLQASKHFNTDRYDSPLFVSVQTAVNFFAFENEFGFWFIGMAPWHPEIRHVRPKKLRGAGLRAEAETA